MQAVDRVTKPIQGVTRSVSSALGEMQNKTQAASAKLQKRMGFARDLMLVGDMASQFGDKVKDSIDKAIDVGKEYESQLSALSAVSGATGRDLEHMGDVARGIGPKFGYTATESVSGLTELSKAGMTAREATDSLQGALTLAAAGEIQVSDSANIGVKAMTQFGLKAKDFSKIADILAAGADVSTADVSDLTQALQMCGNVAGQGFKYSLQETVGALSAFSNAGLNGSDAGTSLKTMLLNLMPQSSTAAKIMDKLGISFVKSGGHFMNLSEVAGELHDKLAHLTDAERQAAMKQMFGTDAVRASNILYSLGADGIKKWTKAVDRSGFAAQQAATRMNNLKGLQKKAEAAKIEAQLVVYQAILPILVKFYGWVTRVTTAVTGWAKRHPILAKTIFVLIAALAALTIALGMVSTVMGIVEVVSAPVTLWILGIGLAIALIATLIITYWKPISRFFVRLWNGIKNTIKAAWNFIWHTLLDNKWVRIFLLIFMPFIGIPVEIMKHWKPISAFFSRIWTGIKNGFKNAWDAVRNYFSNMLTSWWDTFKNSSIGKMIIRAFEWTGKTEISIGKGVAGVWNKAKNGISNLWNSGYGGTDEFGLPAGPPAPSGSPHAALPMSIQRKEMNHNSHVTVQFANVPRGTKINSRGDASGLRLELGYNNVGLG